MSYHLGNLIAYFQQDRGSCHDSHRLHPPNVQPGRILNIPPLHEEGRGKQGQTSQRPLRQPLGLLPGGHGGTVCPLSTPGNPRRHRISLVVPPGQMAALHRSLHYTPLPPDLRGDLHQPLQPRPLPAPLSPLEEDPCALLSVSVSFGCSWTPGVCRWFQWSLHAGGDQTELRPLHPPADDPEPAAPAGGGGGQLLGLEEGVAGGDVLVREHQHRASGEWCGAWRSPAARGTKSRTHLQPSKSNNPFLKYHHINFLFTLF